MGKAAAYNAHSDWYDHYVQHTVPSYFDRVRALVRTLLGPGTGPCLDVCCGTGAHAQTLRDLGWTPIGLDLSAGQLHHASARLPVARADATALPIASRSAPAAVCVLAHTDLPDYPAALAEIARTLRPRAHFVHVGVHPCFVGAFANRADPRRIVIDRRYSDRSHTFDAWCPTGVRARVGAWHLPLADLCNALPTAGLTVRTTIESGPTPNDVPDLFAVLAIRDG
jgi:SAM-dependent methyltransferase